MRNIILLTGASGSGKSTIAKELSRRYGMHIVSLAEPIKNMLITLGLSEREVYGDLKDEPCSLLCDETPRWAMQTLGTEWGRNLISLNLWTKSWQSRVLRVDGDVVVDDCRFNDEIVAASEIGYAKVFRISRDGVNGAGEQHASEIQNVAYDCSISNDRAPSHVADAVAESFGGLHLHA